MGVFNCEDCKNFNWQQASRMWGHPCNIHGTCKDEICTDFNPTIERMTKDENGCLHYGSRGWNPLGVYCGECTHQGLECENRKNVFKGFDNNLEPIIEKGE